MNDIVVVGGVPNPIGGVTTFIRRLLRHEKKIGVLFDLYPAEIKDVPLDYLGSYVCSRWKVVAIFKLYFFLATNKDCKVHFNFSTPRSLMLLRFIPKRGGCWALTLHHGDLGLMEPWMTKVLLKKVNIALPLNDAQYNWYSMCFKSEKIVRSSSYLPAGEPNSNPRLIDMMQGYKKKYNRIIMCSGYPTRIYNHNLAFELMKLRPDDLLICCLYGPGDLRSELVALSMGRNIVIKDSLDEESFNCLLKLSDIYLRLNSKDSFGIAVADAINYGVSVIATDVCARYPGAIIVPVDQSAEELNLTLEDSLKDVVGRRSEALGSTFEYSKVFK